MANKLKVKANGPQLVGGSWYKDGENFEVYDHQARSLQQAGRIHPVVDRFTQEEQALGAHEVENSERKDVTPWPGDTFDPARNRVPKDAANADRDAGVTEARAEQAREEGRKSVSSSRSQKSE